MRYQSATKLRKNEKKRELNKKNFNMKGYFVPLTYLQKMKYVRQAPIIFITPLSITKTTPCNTISKLPITTSFLFIIFRLKFLSQSPAFYRNSSVIYCIMKPHRQIASLAKISQSRQKSNHVKKGRKKTRFIAYWVFPIYEYL